MSTRRKTGARWLALTTGVSLLAAGLIAGSSTAAVASDPPLPSVANPNFATLSSNGLPASWRVWNPAGTAAFSQTTGPAGTTAATIASTSATSARYALVQSVDVNVPSTRTVEVSAQVKGENLATTGFSMLRVQAFNAAGQVTVPIARGPYLTGTFDWRLYSATVNLPAGTTRVSIEPMLDRSGGSLSVTQVELVSAGPAEILDAKATADGPVELKWTAADGAASYSVLRQAAGETAESVVQRAIAPTTADDTVAPGQTYTYRVQALDAAGAVLSSTRRKTVVTASSFADRTDVDIVSALATANGAHVSWAAAATTDLSNLTIQVGNASAVPVTAYGGGVSVAGSPTDVVRLRSGNDIIAEGFVAPSAHPRAFADAATVTRINAELQAGQPTITTAYTMIQNRVAGTLGGYPQNASGGLYKARDAAFLYAVSGNASYAQQAYDGIIAGSSFVAPRDVNMGLELARAALLLAPAYDWAYNGWSESQRVDVRSVMTKAINLLSTYHHDALDSAEKTSNWVGVVRGTELALILAARGDGDFGLHDRRVTFLVDQVNRHLTQGYTDEGIAQEGWSYLHYTELYMFPGLYAAQQAGILAMNEQIERPKFWNMALHVVSSRSRGDTLQQGVSVPNNDVQGAFPLLFPLSPASSTPGLKHLYDDVQGIDSASQQFDGLQALWTVLYYPSNVTSDPTAITAPEAHTALLDNAEGFYAFRNRYQDADDTLVGTAGRNMQHKGWSSAETFSLSWMSHDTTWATLGGKHSDNALLWSKPLVDGKLEPYRNQYETVRGEGQTLAARAFSGQGGGYIELDGSKNFEVDTAHRRQVVDLSTEGSVDAIIAIDDQFVDDTTHSWDWQLRPEDGVTIAVNSAATAAQPLFTFTSTNGAVMSGFVPDRTGLSATVNSGTLRLSRAGTSARFQIVLVAAANAVQATTTSDGLVIDGRVIDLSNLGAVGEGFAEVTSQ